MKVLRFSAVGASDAGDLLAERRTRPECTRALNGIGRFLSETRNYEERASLRG